MQLFLITSALSPRLVLTAAAPEGQQQVDVQYLVDATNPFQLWFVDSTTGQITSASNSSLALGVGDDNVVGLVEARPYEPDQTWYMGGEGGIGLSASGPLLTVSSPTSPLGSLVEVSPIQNDQPPQQQWFLSGFDCNGLLITTVNATDVDLTLTAQSAGSIAPLTLPLPALAAVTVVGLYTNTLEVNFGIWDYSYSSTNTVGAFVAHQHNCVLSAGDVWIDGISFAGGYVLGNVTTEEGSHRHGLPGNASITVTK